MTTPEPTLSEQPEIASTATVTPESEQPQNAATINDLSEEQLLELATGDFSETTVPPAASQQPPDQSAQPETDQQPANADEPESRIKGRISQRFLPPDQQLENAQAYELVRSKQATDLLDALQQIRGIAKLPAASQPPPAEATPEAPAAQEPPAASQPAANTVTELEEQLHSLREQREEAEANYEDPREKARIQNQIEDTIRKIARAEAEAERQQAAAGSYSADYDAAVDELEASYPDALDENSTFYGLLDDKIVAAQARKDPALQDPRFILKFAAEIHDLIAPKVPGRPAPAPTVKAQRPTGAAVAPGHSQAPRPSADQIKAAIDAASPETLLAALSS
jgi:hypothetical protein